MKQSRFSFVGAGGRRALALAGVVAMVAPALGFAAPNRDTPNPVFQRVWARADYPVQQGVAPRSWVWGPRPNANIKEPDVDAPGGQREVQYYDKARMEINDPGGDRNSPWYVTNGLLVVEMISGRMQIGTDRYDQIEPARIAVAGDVADPGDAPTYAALAGVASVAGNEHRAQPTAGAPVDATLSRDGTVGRLPTGNDKLPKTIYYEQTTGHNIPDVFFYFMTARGPVYEHGTYRQGLVFDWIYTMGYPITEPYWISAKVKGKPTRIMVQAFQRRILTYNPENESAWQVEMGNVGMQYYQWRYYRPVPVPTPSPAAGGQVLTSRHFTLPATLSSRQYSAIHDPLYTVAADRQSWTTLWEKHTAMFDASIPPPVVDFAREFVVAAFWGDQQNSCYRLDIGAVTVSDNNIGVNVNQRVLPGTCLTVITQPHDFAAVSRGGLGRGAYKVDFVDSSGQGIKEVDVTLP